MTLARSIFVFLGALVFSVLLWGYVRLSAANEADRDLPVKLIPPKGFALVSGLPERLHTRIRGAGWQILLLDFTHNARFNFDLSERAMIAGDSILIHSDELANSAALPSELHVLKVDPDSLELQFGKAIRKIVPVESRLDVEPASGYTLVGAASLTPNAIAVDGAPQVLDSLRSIPTQSMVVRNARENVDRTLPLSDSLENLVAYQSVPQIAVHVAVEAVGEKRIDNVPVIIQGLPPQYDLVLIPNTISVTLRGGVNELAKLRAQAIHVSVMFDPATLDTASTMVPSVRTAPGITYLFTEPASLKFILRKRSEANVAPANARHATERKPDEAR